MQIESRIETLSRRARRNSLSILLALPVAWLIACQESSERDLNAVADRVQSMFDEGRFLDAIEMLRVQIEERPDDPELQALYGEALLASGQPSLAVWPLARAMRSPDHLVQAGLLLARAQFATGSGADAVGTATRVLEVDPKNEIALLTRIMANLGESLEDKALDDLDRLDEFRGRRDESDFLRLDALLGLGREEEADALLTELAAQADAERENAPARSARLCAAVATFTLERGDEDGAKERFRSCVEGDGVLDPLLFQKATEFFDGHGERQFATDLFKRRFDNDPSRLDERVRYADRLQRTRRFAEGEALLLDAARTQDAAWAALADMYAIEGDFRKAVDALDKAIVASPKVHDDWHFSRADFLLALGEIAEATKALESIEVPAHRVLIEARIAAAKGDLDEATNLFEEGIRLWPDNPDARYLAGQVYERRGKWTEAAAQYREAARMDPPHYESSLALAGLQRALGDLEGVAFLLNRLAKTHPGDPTVAEKLIEYAGDIGSEELGRTTLARLARMREHTARAIALAAERAERAEGAESAMAVIERSNLDSSVPANVALLDAKCRLLIEQERWDDALASIETARAKAPDSAHLLILRASVHRARGELDRAIADLENARRLDGHSTPALLELARAHEAKGDVQVAMKIYAEASAEEQRGSGRESSEGSDATLALARLELASGKTEIARDRLRQALDANPRDGKAAWMMLQSYADGDGADLTTTERADLALRAAVFEGSAAAQDYLKRLRAEKS